MKKLTNHAAERIAERGLTPELIEETIARGRRCIMPFRGTFRFEYKKNGKMYVVITAADTPDLVITSFEHKKHPEQNENGKSHPRNAGRSCGKRIHRHRRA